MNESYIIDREIITDFFKNNLSTHTDWTGTRVETQYKCDSVEEFIEIFMDYLKENNCD